VGCEVLVDLGEGDSCPGTAASTRHACQDGSYRAGTEQSGGCQRRQCQAGCSGVAPWTCHQPTPGKLGPVQFNEAVARARDKFRMRMSLAVPGLVAVWAEAEVGRQIDDGHSCVAGPLDDGRGGAVGRGAEQHVTCAYHFVLVCETQV